MSSQATVMQYDTLRSLAFGSISSSYVKISVPFNQQMRHLVFTNSTDQSLLISQDGVTDNHILLPSSVYVFDITANKTRVGHVFFPSQQQFYVKYETSAPTKGKVYLTTAFGRLF